MKPDKNRGITITFLAIAIIGSSANSRSVTAQSQSVIVELIDGAMITAEISPMIIDWTNVQENGQMTAQRINTDDISQLTLTNEPASKQIANIRRLITELGSLDYHQRESAEHELSKPIVGGPYKALIRRYLDDEIFEVRYRVGRVLHELDKQSIKKSPTMFDRLTLTNGDTLDGDAGELRLECKYAGRDLILTRDQLRGLRQPHAPIIADQPPQPVDVGTFHRYENDFFRDYQTVVEFEEDPLGKDLIQKTGRSASGSTVYTDVSNTFTDLGLKLAMEGKGFVGISGYKFKTLPAQGNSVCVFNTSGRYPKRFQGIIDISFGVPHQPAIPAGVTEFGLFLASVEHRRDFILEAYNDLGHILATVEATDNDTVFMGVKSNELIARVRVLSNPYLPRISRAIDVDYAIDNVCFSTPEPLTVGTSLGLNQIRLRNGDMHVVGQIDISDGQIVIKSAPLNETFRFGLEQVQEIRTANELSRTSNDWLVMLPDASIVAVELGQQLQSVQFGGRTIDRSSIVAMAAGRTPFRYAESSDFDKGKVVLVFPTCRIATDEIHFNNDTIEWDQSAEKIEQPLLTGNRKKDDEDPTPQSNSIRFDEPHPADMPTIWFTAPSSRSSSRGLIQLTDGQQFTLDGETGFKLTGIDKDGIIISWNEEQISVPWEDVHLIKFQNTDK